MPEQTVQAKTLLLTQKFHFIDDPIVWIVVDHDAGLVFYKEDGKPDSDMFSFNGDMEVILVE